MQNLKAEIIRFEDEVIRGGPISLPGAQSLLEQVRCLLLLMNPRNTRFLVLLGIR